jgi:2-polyprenyl-3-methyl-5-hydroxy-6-metoxy-1,4-benzoquinol methylase
MVNEMIMETQPAMTSTALDSLRAFRTKSRHYLSLGHDRLAAARFVADAAGEFRGLALDIGTGKGLLSIALARRGLEVLSIDVDPRERELARLLAEEEGLAARIRFEQADAAHLPYSDGQYGCVAMMDVLHHLAEPVPILKEMARVTARGGIVIIADFDESGFDIVSRIHRANGGEHPRTAASVSLALAELSRLGFACRKSINGHQHEMIVLQKSDELVHASEKPRDRTEP